MKVKTESETRAEMLNCIVWAGICLMFLYTLTGCTTGGGKICFGYEEVNQIKNSSGYDIPEKKK